MSLIQDTFASYFSSSEQNRGEDLFSRNAVLISSASDTDVRALIRASTPARVTLSAAEVGAADFSGRCSCPVARKGNLCRHVWAVLLALEDKGYDFLEGKEAVSVNESEPSIGRESAPKSERSIAYAEEQKARAKEYRKQNAEKAKARNKEFRERIKDSNSSKKNRAPAFSYPAPVEEARQYFQANGFTMSQPIEMEELLNAKKQLSRVFHPDKGGTHDEILELNENFQTILDYLKS